MMPRGEDLWIGLEPRNGLRDARYRLLPGGWELGPPATESDDCAVRRRSRAPILCGVCRHHEGKRDPRSGRIDERRPVRLSSRTRR